MNKLFTKIASLTLGLALVASAGALIGKGMEAKSVSAGEIPAYSLSGMTAGSGNSYTGDNTATQSGVSWIINGNATTTPWRLGGNAKSHGTGTEGGVARLVKSSTVVSTEDISKIILNVTNPASNNITVNSLRLLVGTSAGASDVSIVSHAYSSGEMEFTRPNDADWSSRYFTFEFVVYNSTNTTKFIEFRGAVFYYESSYSPGEVSISGLSSNLIEVGDSEELDYGWDPLDSGATISTFTFSSSNTDVLSFSENTYSAVASGTATITLTATDTNGTNYEVTQKVYVTEEYVFEVGDNVALCAEEPLMELGTIEKIGSNVAGTGVSYSDSPNGVYLLSVETGDPSYPGSLSFNHVVSETSNYLTWSSGNTLETSSTKSDESSWYVVYNGTSCSITNAKESTRTIWWNPPTSTAAGRFACYSSSSSSYKATNLYKIEEVPIRGTLEITSPEASTTVVKQGTVGELAFTWTPNEEAPSVTISTYEWHSSNTDAISISGDSFTAVAAGKSRLSLTATDSTGQEYSVSMPKDIEVVAVVSGTYEKVTSVSDGDVVALVCEEDRTELSNVKSNVGEYVFYETAPASVYDLTVIARDGYYLLMDSSGKYLTWGADGQAYIKLVEEADIEEKSYWSISFTDGNANIVNKEADGGEDHRYIAWNHNSPRFGAYKTGQTSVQLYAPVTSYSEAVVTFAEKVLNELECDASGDTAPKASEWTALKTAFTTTITEDADISALRSATPVEHEDPSTDVEKVQAAVAKYDYVVAKYGSETYEDFIGRNPAPLKVITDNGGSINNSTTSIVVVTIISLVSISSIAVLLVIKKRKHN